MARFTSMVDVEAPVDRVWRRITDWPEHGRWIPLTTVRVTSVSPEGVGARFVGRSAIGPVGFDDPMEVDEWSAPAESRPGHCRVRKQGRVVLGWAEFEVGARSGGTRVTWTEEIELAPARLTRPFGRLIAAGGKFGFDRALRTMARELEAEVAAGG